MRRPLAPWLTALLLLVFAARGPARADSWDVWIRNGRVMDGTGKPAAAADVAVRDGRVVAVGRLDASEARTVIDASGKIVAPGFIDVHTHSDKIAKLPLAVNLVRMGVTTVVTGNCGGSSADIGAFLRELDAAPVSINVGTLIGHGTVRAKAMGGSHNRVPTADELAQMRALIEGGMREGAFGLSTGLIYPPGMFARTAELVEAARAIAPFDGIYATHMRSEAVKIFDALEETFRIGREAGVRVEISHIKLSAPAVWGRAADVLAAIARARAAGLEITHDQYAYTASSTGLRQLIPEWAMEGGSTRFAERLDDDAQHARITADMRRRLKRDGSPDYSYVTLATCRADRSFDGMRLADAARARLGSDSLDSQIEMILEIQRRGGASAIYHKMCEEDLRVFLRDPHTLVASDGHPLAVGKGVVHPRSNGNNVRVLGRYARALGVLRLEEAIRRMTSLPAATFRIRDRGTLRPGAWADLVVFDPETVSDTAMFEASQGAPVGISCVLVNGVVVVHDDRHTGARPGKALRRGE